jgi:hypothetical protein
VLSIKTVADFFARIARLRYPDGTIRLYQHASFSSFFFLSSFFFALFLLTFLPLFWVWFDHARFVSPPPPTSSHLAVQIAALEDAGVVVTQSPARMGVYMKEAMDNRGKK